MGWLLYILFRMKSSYANKCVSILFDARFCNGRRNFRACSRGSETWKTKLTKTSRKMNLHAKRSKVILKQPWHRHIAPCTCPVKFCFPYVSVDKWQSLLYVLSLLRILYPQTHAEKYHWHPGNVQSFFDRGAAGDISRMSAVSLFILLEASPLVFAALKTKAKEIAREITPAMQATYRGKIVIITVTLTNASDSKGGSFKGSAFFSLSLFSFTSLVAASKPNNFTNIGIWCYTLHVLRDFS